ncbi:50S ribosomal protein L29 [bacterium]|nr:50S ribosomal protein L29 [bacterium]
MKYKDLEKKELKGLNELLKENREHLRALKFSVGSQQEKDVRGLRKARHGIAQILTEMNNRKTKNQETKKELKKVNDLENKKTINQKENDNKQDK